MARCTQSERSAAAAGKSPTLAGCAWRTSARPDTQAESRHVRPMIARRFNGNHPRGRYYGRAGTKRTNRDSEHFSPAHRLPAPVAGPGAVWSTDPHKLQAGISDGTSARVRRFARCPSDRILKAIHHLLFIVHTETVRRPRDDPYDQLYFLAFVKLATASELHKGTRKTNTSTNHLPHHTHHERPNTHYGDCSSWYVLAGAWLLMVLSGRDLQGNWFSPLIHFSN